MAGSEHAAGEMASSESESDRDSTTTSISNPVNLIAKPGKIKSPVWSYFGFVLILVLFLWFYFGDGKPKDLQKPVCKKCYNTVTTKGSNTTNLFQHLKLHRYIIFKSVRDLQNESTTESHDDKEKASTESRQMTILESVPKFQRYPHNGKNGRN